MNYYFLVEGNQTEMKFYPKLISHFYPQYTQISELSDFKNNNFYMFSGGGNPSIFKKMKHALADIADINKNAKHTKIKIDILFLVLDSDKYCSFESAIQSVNNHIEQHKSEIRQAKVNVIPIVQRECIESWFLGNYALFPSQYSNDIKNLVEHYDVRVNDPELMPSNSEKTKGQFAYYYLTKLCFENGWIYTKSSIDNVTTEICIDNIYRRSLETGQLRSFTFLINNLKKYS